MPTRTAPLYKKIKQHILDHIGSGEWQPSERVPSENELVKTFGVSRMTTNRALKELTEEGYLIRVAGVGTFVSDLKAHSHPLEVHNIADEIRSRGHAYHAHVISMAEVEPDELLRERMAVPEGMTLFHSVIIHEEQGLPVQLEDRYVSKVVAPEYGAQDFSVFTPYDYLMKIAPLQKAEHVVKAVNPDAHIRDHLKMLADEPCLLVERRTWTNGKIASSAKLYHPGNRYELSGLFKP